MLLQNHIWKVLVAVVTFHTILSEDYQLDFNILSDTLKVIFRDVFKKTNKYVHLVTNITHYRTQHYVNDLLDDILKGNKEIQLPIVLERNDLTPSTTTNYFHARVIITENLKSVRFTIQSIMARDEMQGVNSNYLIIYLTEKSGRILADMQKLFRFFFNSFIINVNVLLYKDSSIFVYTYYPFAPKKCSNIKPVFLMKFDRVPQQLSYHSFYPPKVKNLHKCPVKVLIYDIPPFTEFINMENNYTQITGYDVQVLRDIANIMNFKIIWVDNDPPNFIGGHVYENYTVTGSFKMLRHDKADMIIGDALCSSKRGEMFSSSMPYFLNVYVIVLKNREKPSLELFLQPFQLSTWLFIAAAVVVKYICYKWVFSSRHSLSGSFSNLFTLASLSLAFLLQSSYEGSLYQIMHNSPFEALPKSVKALLEQNYTLLTDSNTASILDNLANFASITSVVSHHPFDCLDMLDNIPGKAGVLVSLPYVTYYMYQHLEKLPYYAMVQEPVFTGMNCIYFPRHTLIKKAIDNILTKLRLYGFIDAYSKYFQLGNAPLKTDKLARRPQKSLHTPLTLELLGLVFKGLLALEGLACLIFLLERSTLHFDIFKRILNKFHFLINWTIPLMQNPNGSET